ncbi:predicted protein [Nematostella vectensis]|uniref:SAM domain-containing protein n=1 Tax=Nematostella vectensis TaxID=45351 RepID=A7STB5_NEMVE|nr:predicted protein [Nematostella vectensis]|eukprot:XP_001625146.1 predicted protein [Nematostella vectensis]
MQEDDITPLPPPRGSSLSKEQKRAQTVKTNGVSQYEDSQAEIKPTIKPRTRFTKGAFSSISRGRTRLEAKGNDYMNYRTERAAHPGAIECHEKESIASQGHKIPPSVKAKPHNLPPATSRTVNTATDSASPRPRKVEHESNSGFLRRQTTVKTDSRGYVDTHSVCHKYLSDLSLSEKNKLEDLNSTPPTFHEKMNETAGLTLNAEKGYAQKDELIKGPRQVNSCGTDPGRHKTLTATVSLPCDFKEQGSDIYFEVKSIPGTNADRVNDLSIPPPPNPSKIEEWTVDDVANYLVYIKLGKYAESFKQKQVDGGIFLVLDEDILREDFGIKSRFERTKLCLAQKGWTPKTG